MFEQAALPIQDEARFAIAKDALEEIFAPGDIAAYLRRLSSAKVRVRDFESALDRGLMGKAMVEAYAALDHSDRGQVRELYLSRVERVAPELRQKFLKLYAYY